MFIHGIAMDPIPVLAGTRKQRYPPTESMEAVLERFWPVNGGTPSFF